MRQFPTCLFAPNGTEPFIDRRVVSGGTSLSGDETLIGTDGGGRVALEISDFDLDDPDVANAWDMLDALMDGGLVPMAVPFCDGRHQPTFYFDGVPHSDGAPFSDDSLYQTAGTDVTLTEDAILGATVLHVNVALLDGYPRGWFSIDHPTWRHRAYKVAEIRSTTGDTAVISVRPRLREAAPAGTRLDFSNPRCTMRLDGEMRAPRTMGYAEGQPLRFVEDMSGSYA